MPASAAGPGMYNAAPSGPAVHGACVSIAAATLSTLTSSHAVTSPLLEAVALACERDWRMLFEDLHLQLASGQMLQVVGPNGSGKTSLLRLLCGLMQPTAGEVLLAGRPLHGQRDELARSLLWLGPPPGVK